MSNDVPWYVASVRVLESNVCTRHGPIPRRTSPSMVRRWSAVTRQTSAAGSQDLTSPNWETMWVTGWPKRSPRRVGRSRSSQLDWSFG